MTNDSFIRTGEDEYYPIIGDSSNLKLDKSRRISRVPASDPIVDADLDPISAEGMDKPKPTPEAVADPVVHEFGSDTAVFRCDYLYRYFRTVDTHHPEDLSNLDTDAAPEGAYYRDDALRLLTTPFRDTYKDLYDWIDMSEPMTQADEALLEWTSEGYPVDTEYRDEMRKLIDDGLRVVVYKDSQLHPTVEMKLANYPRSTRTFSQWLQEMAKGSQGIPVPLLVAMLHSPKIENTKQGILVALQKEISVGDLQ